jgi:hypothetical protein
MWILLLVDPLEIDVQHLVPERMHLHLARYPLRGTAQLHRQVDEETLPC